VVEEGLADLRDDRRFERPRGIDALDLSAECAGNRAHLDVAIGAHH